MLNELQMSLFSSVCVCLYGGTPRVMIFDIGNGHGMPSSNPGRIYHSANTLRKAMHATIMSPAMDKL